MTSVPSDRDALLAHLAAFRPGPGGVHLTQLCRTLRAALGVGGVRLSLPDGREYSWPARPIHEGHRGHRWIPLTAGGEQVGLLGLQRGVLPPGRRRERLLTEVTDLLGPVLRAVGVRGELDRSLESARGHAERVAAVRRRSFGERDAEREEIERDLHDGAQHHLVALGMTVGLLEVYARDNNQAGLRGQLERLRNGLDRAEESLLTTATGYSPLLQQAGVHPALLSEFRDVGTRVRMDTTEWDVSRRHEPTVEMAVYFICLEAVNNARKHASEAQIVVRLAEGPAGLAFSVTDDGPGLRRSDLLGSSGMVNMRRRIVAAGGQLQVRAAPGAGTAVHGFIPS